MRRFVEVSAVLSLLAVVHPRPVQANPGEDGAQVFLSGSSVVNSFTALTAQSGSTLTVASAAALTLPGSACPVLLGGCLLTNRALAAGDLLLVYQPQGATIDTASDSVAYGTISAYNGVGRYEFVYVAAVAGNVVTIADSDAASSTCSGGLRFAYGAGAMVVRVPQYSSLSISAGAAIIAPAWDGSVGGVVAAHVADTGGGGNATINGSIDASGRGFRGGVKLDRAVVYAITSHVCATPNGAQKGEGVASAIFASTNNLCRGAPGNGGGGGNNHNAGGGGGANGGFNSADPTAGGWNRGIGVYPPGPGGSGTGSPFSFLTVWALDLAVDPDGAGANPPQTSTGGGRGGYTYAADANNPQTTAPGATGWNGDFRREVGGLGGRPLNGNPSLTDPYRRLYFGGGGGAGEMNNAQGGNGGAGGGLVFLIAQTITGSGQILANGAAGQNTSGAGNNDAPGGGGGGGSIVLQLRNAATVPAAITLGANGGVGGNQLAIGPESEGPGGGGSGGVIAAPTGGTQNVLGGAGGTSVSSGLRASSDPADTRRFPPNGATAGAAGSITTPPPRHGGSSPFSCLEGPGFTTPVTIAWFHSTLESAGQVRIEFAAAAEIAHAGYALEAQTADGALQQLGALVAADAAEADRPRSYSVLRTLPIGATQLFVSDIDLHGRKTRRGPFLPGSTHGSQPSESRYDWTRSRLQRDAQQRQRVGDTTSVARLGVSERGMYRLEHQQLLASGVDFSGVPAANLAVVGDAGPVPRRIRGPAVFGPGSSIEFFGDAVATLWSRERFYLLVNDPARATDMRLTHRVVQAAAPSSYRAQLRYAPQTAYNHASPSGDPWYADRLLASDVAVSKSVALDGPAPLDGTGELELVVWGGIDWPGALPDHSVQVLLNGQIVASRRFDGLALEHLRIPVQLSGNHFEVQLRLPADSGQPLDIVHLESISLAYRAAASGDGSRFFGAELEGSAWDTVFAEGGGDPAGAPIAGVVSVSGVAGPDLRAYRISGGAASEFAVTGQGPLVALYAQDFDDPGELWVSPAAVLPSPSVSLIAAPVALPSAPVDWLVISHGVFLPALQPLVALRQSQGLRTEVVEVAAIDARYSAGNPDPQAIARHIAAARAASGMRYVLLVGADTLDAPGYLGSGSVSFVPTPYVTTSAFVRYAPGDPLLADVDADGVADLALGRLPVRTLAEAQEAVRKIVAYETQPARQRVLVAAGAQDPLEPRSFASASTSFAGGLQGGWSIDSVYQDSMGLDAARLAIVEAFNSGRSLVSYMGHSGPGRWTFDPLFDISQVLGSSTAPGRPNLLDSANQPVVLQYACWTTYFVSATQNSMAQALLLTPGRGASAIVGATVLLDQRSHERMSAALAGRLQAGVRIGDAVLAAQRELAADQKEPVGAEILLGQVLLGDPAQPLR